MKSSDALAIGLGIGGGAVIAGKIYDAWPFTWDDILTAAGRIALESQRKSDPDAFDRWILDCVTQMSGATPSLFEAFDSLGRLNQDLNLNLTTEENWRICRKLPGTRIPSLPITGPIISQPRPAQRKKGGRKRNGASKFETAPAELALTGIASRRLLTSAPAPPKQKGRRTNSRNRKTDRILELYDNSRRSGCSDEEARNAVARVLVNDSKRGSKAIRRSVDGAVRKHRKDGKNMQV